MSGLKRKRSSTPRPETPADGAQQSSISRFFASPSPGGAPPAAPPPPPAALPLPAWGAVVSRERERLPCAPPFSQLAWCGPCFSHPFANDTRHPSAGHGGSLDRIRASGSAYASSPAAAAAGPHGWLRRNLSLVLASVNKPGVAPGVAREDAALASTLHSFPPDRLALVASLFYSRDAGFHRLAGRARPPAAAPALGTLSLADLRSLENGDSHLHAPPCISLASAASPPPPAFLSTLLTSAEADGVARAAGVARGGHASRADALAAALGASSPSHERRRLVSAALSAAGPVVSLRSDVGDSLVRIHRIAFVAAGYTPAEASSLLGQDMEALRLGRRGGMMRAATPPASPAPAAADNAAADDGAAAASSVAEAAALLHSAAACCDALHSAASRGDADAAFAALHSASCLLLPPSSPPPPLTSSPLASVLTAAALESACRCVLRGCSLLERESRASDALHYLRCLLHPHSPAASSPTCALPRSEAALRLALACERLGRGEEGLLACIAALESRGGGGGGAAGAARVGLGRVAARLAAPPRRWRAPQCIPVVFDAPSEKAAIPRRASDGAWLIARRAAVDQEANAADGSGDGSGAGGDSGSDASPESGSTGSVEEASLRWLAKPENGGWSGAHTENAPWVALYSHLFRDLLIGEPIAADGGGGADDGDGSSGGGGVGGSSGGVGSGGGQSVRGAQWLSPLADGPLCFRSPGLAAAFPSEVAARCDAIRCMSPAQLSSEVAASIAATASPLHGGGAHTRGIGAPLPMDRGVLPQGACAAAAILTLAQSLFFPPLLFFAAHAQFSFQLPARWAAACSPRSAPPSRPHTTRAHAASQISCCGVSRLRFVTRASRAGAMWKNQKGRVGARVGRVGRRRAWWRAAWR